MCTPAPITEALDSADPALSRNPDPLTFTGGIFAFRLAAFARFQPFLLAFGGGCVFATTDRLSRKRIKTTCLCRNRRLYLYLADVMNSPNVSHQTMTLVY